MSATYESLYQLWKRKEQERRERERWLADPELAEARRRFPLIPKTSDEDVLRIHRENPREGRGA